MEFRVKVQGSRGFARCVPGEERTSEDETLWGRATADLSVVVGLAAVWFISRRARSTCMGLFQVAVVALFVWCWQWRVLNIEDHSDDVLVCWLFHRRVTLLVTAFHIFHAINDGTILRAARNCTRYNASTK